MPTLSPAHTSSRTWLPGDGRTNMDADTVIMTRIKGGQDSEGVDRSAREARDPLCDWSRSSCDCRISRTCRRSRINGDGAEALKVWRVVAWHGASGSNWGTLSAGGRCPVQGGGGTRNGAVRQCGYSALVGPGSGLQQVHMGTRTGPWFSHALGPIQPCISRVRGRRRSQNRTTAPSTSS
jgi:hypothetical protein